MPVVSSSVCSLRYSMAHLLSSSIILSSGHEANISRVRFAFLLNKVSNGGSAAVVIVRQCLLNFRRLCCQFRPESRSSSAASSLGRFQLFSALRASLLAKRRRLEQLQGIQYFARDGPLFAFNSDIRPCLSLFL